MPFFSWIPQTNLICFYLNNALFFVCSEYCKPCALFVCVCLWGTRTPVASVTFGINNDWILIQYFVVFVWLYFINIDNYVNFYIYLHEKCEKQGMLVGDVLCLLQLKWQPFSSSFEPKFWIWNDFWSSIDVDKNARLVFVLD